MKKEMSPAVVIGAAIGLIAVVVFAIFFAIKSDPASQAPHPPPRFDPGVKAAEAAHNDPRLNRAPPGAPPGPGAPR